MPRFRNLLIVLLETRYISNFGLDYRKP